MNIGKTHITPSHFDKLWKQIEHELNLLYQDKKCSGSVIYNNIYIICTSTSHKYVEDLYWKIGDFFYEVLKNIKFEIYKSDNWIKMYTLKYKKYLDFVTSINLLADYLNQFITTKSIYQFSFLLWERCILQPCSKYKGSNLGEFLINHDDVDEISLCIQSFKQIVVDQEKPLLYYIERYEKFAFSKIIDIINQFIITNTSSDIKEYTVRLNMFINQLREKRNKIFLKESWKRHDTIVEDLLINQKKKWMKNEIYKIISQHTLPLEILNTIRNSMKDTKKCEPVKIETFQNSNLNNSVIEDFHTNNKETSSTSFINEKTPVVPLNDFYALFSDKVPSLYTYTTLPLTTIKEISKNLSVIKQASEVLDSVLLRYLSTQFSAHSHLFDKKIETLYIFYTLFNHIVKVGFLNSKSANNILHTKLKEVFNSLSPSLIDRLIKFSNTIVKGECVKEKKQVIFRKELIDFYEKGDVFNMNEEEGIDYWGDDDSDQSDNLNDTDKLSESVPFDIYQGVPFANTEKNLPSKEDYDVSKKSLYKQRQNKSLPDLTSKKLNTSSYKDSALLRVFLHLYDLVEDKLDFYKKYIKEMCKRVLITDFNYYKELEIFNLLECEDRDLALKSEIIFTDMLSMINDKSSVHLLTESAWNLDYELININLPSYFVDVVKSVSKTRVKWVWEYSIVHIQINKNTYKLNFLQYLVINLFNTHKEINKNIIKLHTGLQEYVLDNIMKSLIKSNLIYFVEDNIFLNISCNILNISEYYIKEDINKEHEINKEMFYLGKIASILKREKKLNKEELFIEIYKYNRTNFSISDDDLIKGVEGCKEKGIIEERGNYLIYLP